MRSKTLYSIITIALLGATSSVRADPIVAGQTTWLAKAIQDVTLFPNTSINPTNEAIFIDDLFGIATAGFNREMQIGDTIAFNSVVGWDFVGSLPGIGDYRFGVAGPFTGSDYSGEITNVVQDASAPGFSSGDPSSFASGDVTLSGAAFGFEFLSGPLAGVVLTTDPTQNFAFVAQFDALPPSVGTTFTNSGDEVLNVFFNGELVGTSSDRRVVTIPEPSSCLSCLLGLIALLVRRSIAQRGVIGGFLV